MERDRLVLEALIDLVPQIADRTTRPGHLTGSALVVDPRNRRLLLLHHRKLQMWLQPGGHADGDTNLASVALREATEESGIEGLTVLLEPIDVDIHRVAPPREDPHLHLDVRFLVLAPAGAVAAINHESTGSKWVEFSELAHLGVDPGLVRMGARAHTLCVEHDWILI
jgi:8-oxo-dGTP pyrophosphatase MutT (NUDIX family)